RRARGEVRRTDGAVGVDLVVDELRRTLGEFPVLDRAAVVPGVGGARLRHRQRPLQALLVRRAVPCPVGGGRVVRADRAHLLHPQRRQLLLGDRLPAGDDRAGFVEERDVRLGESRDVDEGGGPDAAAVENDLFRLGEEHLEHVRLFAVVVAGSGVDVVGPHELGVGVGDAVGVDADAAEELPLDLRVGAASVLITEVEDSGAHDAFSVAPDPVDTADVHRDGLRLAAVGVFLVPAQRDGQVGPGEGAGGELAAVAGDDAFDGEGAFPGGGLPGVVHAVVVRLVGLVVVHVGACRVGFSLGGVAALQFAFFVDDGPRRVGTAVRVVLHRAVHGASF